MLRAKTVTAVTGTLLFVLVACAPRAAVEWKSAEECSLQIARGLHGKALDDARARIRQERWNADAYACRAMAYYARGNTEFALKGLKEAEDTLPRETIDGIHDRLWIHQPELLAEKEHRTFSALAGGDCLLRNVAALEGNGALVLGYFFNPEVKERIRHIRALKCGSETERCAEVDTVCPACVLEEKEAVITIKEYRVVAVEQLISDRPIERNLRYIEKILELEQKKKQ